LTDILLLFGNEKGWGILLVLISYDVAIENNGQKRLRRVAKACQNYGQRVQYSIFECVIDPAQWTVLRQKLIDEIEPELDSLRFYFLGSNWRRRVEHIGAKKSIDMEAPLTYLWFRRISCYRFAKD
jgi:CRISPR-associated protein Cas2